MPSERFPLDRHKLKVRRGKSKQKAIADALDIDVDTYSHWETGRTKPDFRMAGQLAEVLKCELEDLRDLSEDTAVDWTPLERQPPISSSAAVPPAAASRVTESAGMGPEALPLSTGRPGLFVQASSGKSGGADMHRSIASRAVASKSALAGASRAPAKSLVTRGSRDVAPLSGDLPDIFTPGFDEAILTSALPRLLAKEQVAEVLRMSREAIAAVENGDFGLQVDLGKTLISVAAEVPDLLVCGSCFAAEGYRLLADIEPDANRRAQLWQDSSKYYTDIISLSPNAPSAYRGLGRITELSGDLDEALRLFDIAHGYAQAEFASNGSQPLAPALAHEILRTSRHRIHCILAIRDSAPASKWNSEVSESEIRGDIEKADRYHRELMQLFSSQPKWMRIEYFMAMVFLALAWGALGNSPRAQCYFLDSLYVRRLLITNTQTLSAVEVSNLRWWSKSVASTTGMVRLLYEQAERLLSILSDGGNGSSILDVVDEIIRPVKAATQMRPQ